LKKNNGLSFATLDISSLNQILELERYTGHYAWPLHSYEMAFRKNWSVLGVFNDTHLLGVVVYHIVFEQCTLLNIFSTKTALNRGVASGLISWMVTDATNKGCDTVFLEVRSNNLAAVNLYQKFGFEIVNTRISYYRYNKQEYDAYEMALHLFTEL